MKVKGPQTTSPSAAPLEELTVAAYKDFEPI